ncbi:MAG TPA: tetratricopeptide repeat protein [Terriglobales bacterium]|nr:tetratricopeptide repeat protein [Terriglobales bacterium]
MRRWEVERGLPVHRVPGSSRGVVYAFTNELEEWLRSRPDQPPEAEPGKTAAGPVSIPDLKSTDGQAGGSVVMKAEADRELSWKQEEAVGATRGRLLRWLAVLVLAAAAAGLVYSYRQTIRFAARAGGSHWGGTANDPHVPTPEVQDLYLKGRYFWSKRTPEDLNKAVDYFTQAIVKDPGYAPAFVGLADCYNLLREFSAMPPEDAYPRALAAAQKAVELDPSSAEAHNSLAFATFYWNWDAVMAEHEFKRALKLSPNFVQAHHWYATFLLALRRFPEALDQIEQARKLDPSSTSILADKGFMLWQNGRRQEALSLLKQLSSVDPTLATTHAYLAKGYWQEKDYRNYFKELEKAAELRGDRGAQAVAEAARRGFETRGLQGMREEVLPVQEKLFAKGNCAAFDLAVTYAALGRTDDAIRLLRTAFERHEISLIFLSGNTDEQNDFRGIAHEAGYLELLDKVKERVNRNVAAPEESR